MLYLGIDGGGTKTEFCLADSSGQVISRTVLGPSNPVDIGIEETISVLKEGVFAVLPQKLQQETSVFAGIAGILGGSYKEMVTAFLKSFDFLKVRVGSDVENAVAACLGRADGVAVIMGTGTIAFAQKDGVYHRFGGFGYLFDEGGSGYAIGRDGILSALKSEEGSGASTTLEQSLKETYAVDILWDAIPPIYKGGKREIASFAPTVFAAAKKNDAVALSILQKNMQAVAENINHAVEIFPKQAVPVGLIGGITGQKDVILPMIEKQVSPKAEIFVCEKTQGQGALYLAGMENKTC